jgi:5-methylcytosine-specific restriction endonuclease McrA
MCHVTVPSLRRFPTLNERTENIAKNNEFYSILSAIKRCFSRSPVHNSVRRAALDPSSSGPRGGKRYICSVCGQSYGVKEIQVDHKDPIVPVGTLSKDMSWDNIIRRTFCAPENLQVLCSDCHKAKSKIECSDRTRIKKEKKNMDVTT